MKRISREHHTAYLDPALTPVAKLQSGEEALVETYDAFLGHWNKGQWPKELGSVTGPIEIEGAQPGDTLEVELLEITPLELKPGRGAVHHTKGGMGFLPEEFTEHYPVVYAIREGNLVHPTGLRIPLDPSLGFIGTTYTTRQKTSSDSGPYGGDIDMKELRAGSTVWLPVFVPGAMLCLGDIHAAIGDGAVGGTAAEAAGEVKIRVTLQKGKHLVRPRVMTKDHFITLSYGEDVGDAMRTAVRDMVQFLTEEKGMQPYDAYGLLSIAGDVRINRTFRPVSPVKMMLSRSVLRDIEKQFDQGRA